jgi:four helix bundle protein
LFIDNCKTTIALKECAETEYWLDLLKETKILTQEEHESIINDCKDILHILIAVAKTTRNKLTKEK